MNKKNFIGLITIIIALIILSLIIALGGLYKILPSEVEKKLEALPAMKRFLKTGDVGYGWSVKDTADEALKEAVFMMEKRLGGKKPNYVLMWYTIGYNPAELKEGLKNLLGGNVQIQGSSSAVAVMTPDGYHIGNVGSLAILGIASEKVKIGVGGADLGKLTPKEAGKKAIEEAILNSGGVGDPARVGDPKFVYITAAPGKEEEILLGVEEVIGREVPIIGGSSGDETLSGKWSQINNDEIYSNGVALGVVYTDLKVGTAHEFGYMQSIEKGIVTKAEGRTLYQIDGKPAGEVYNKWTGGHFNKEVKSGGNILAEATFYPLAKIVRGSGGETYLCVSHPGVINSPDKSMTMFTNMENGDEIQLLHGNWEWLVNRAQSTARQAMLSQNISQGEGLFSFYTFCAGTLLAIPKSERPKVPRLLTAELGSIPFIGGFTLGEQVFMPGVGNRHANLVNSIAIFK